MAMLRSLPRRAHGYLRRVTTHAQERGELAGGTGGRSTFGALLVGAAALLGIVAARVLDWRSRAGSR